MGASLTCGSDAMPVLLRPCSLMALRAALHLATSPSSTRRLGTFRGGEVGAKVRALWNQGLKSSSFDNLLCLALLHPQVLSWLC